MKNGDNSSKLFGNLSLWTVWYEDRFGWGSDRYPASLVAIFLDKLEAEQFINSREGPIDIKSGKFDGLFLREWQALEFIKAKLAREADIQKLLTLEPPARLLAHWKKGWISP